MSSRGITTVTWVHTLSSLAKVAQLLPGERARAASALWPGRKRKRDRLPHSDTTQTRPEPAGRIPRR